MDCLVSEPRARRNFPICSVASAASGGAEIELVDVGQALAGFQDDVDSGFGRRCGQAFGIAEQQVGRAYLYKQRREPG